jgi:ribosomal-protein-alanine N-acetyltransferase
MSRPTNVRSPAQIIGHVVFHADRRRPEVITVSYEVAQPFWNKRYASESVPPLVDDLLANADVIRAEVMRGDVRSKKVLARAGLARTDERGFGEIWERRRL